MTRLAGQVLAPENQAQEWRAEATQRKQTLYLKGVARLGTQTAGCRAAKVDSRTVYQWREHDPTFIARERLAKEELADSLEAEAVRRGVLGVTVPVYQAGRFVGTRVEYSDALLTLVLRGARPEKYRDRVDLAVPMVIKAISGIEPDSVL